MNKKTSSSRRYVYGVLLPVFLLCICLIRTSFIVENWSSAFKYGHFLSNESPTFDDPPKKNIWEPWRIDGRESCPGYYDYKKWIKMLFEMAPSPPSCWELKNFTQQYMNTSANSCLKGTVLLRRNSLSSTKFEAIEADSRTLSRRGSMIANMWKEANLRRNLPSKVELIVYYLDKPRTDNGCIVPRFSFSVDQLPTGSGYPKAWKNPLPFPSWFFNFSVPKNFSESQFWKRRPVVFFRGRFSENIWTHPRLPSLLSNNSSCCFSILEQLEKTPRFKLALAASQPNNSDVLDISLSPLTEFPISRVLNPLLEKYLLKHFGIKVGKKQADMSPARYALSVPSNGWPGTSTMLALLSGACVLVIQDNSTDNEGFKRTYGEIYFPFMTPGLNYIPVTYSSLAGHVRALNEDPVKALQIARQGTLFAQKYLGIECALDIIELLSWHYHEYIIKGCKTAFDHIL